MLYCSWDIARDRCNCYFSFWVIFYPFIPHAPSPPNSPKNENFKKKRKKHHEISSFNTSVPKIMIILRYGVWQMQLLFFILGYFLPFYPPKSENFKKIKKTTGDIILQNCTKIMIMCYTVPEIWHMMDVIVIFHFGPLFALIPP